MFIPFLYELRARKVPVGTQEAVALAKALSLGLHEDSLDGFYYMARALCFKARDSYGSAKDGPPPAKFHYEQWLGPAPMRILPSTVAPA